MKRYVRAWLMGLDRWWFDGADGTVVPFVRIAFALMVLIQVAVWYPDAGYWFSDEGVLTLAQSEQLRVIPQWSVFEWFPNTPLFAQGVLVLVAIHALLMLLGIYSRFQALMLFVGLMSIHHRNPMITDGEDTVFRLFAFSMMFLPLDARWSIRSSIPRSGTSRLGESGSAWGLRLMQSQIVMIYLSAVWYKSQSPAWQDGNVMYWVSRMEDLYGRLLSVEFFDSLTVSRVVTWGALAIEAFLPIGLWMRPTRRLALLLGFGLHLGIEATMHLFLFQWVMMLGLVTFMTREDVAWITLGKLGRRIEGASEGKDERLLLAEGLSAQGVVGGMVDGGVETAAE